MDPTTKRQRISNKENKTMLASEQLNGMEFPSEDSREEASKPNDEEGVKHSKSVTVPEVDSGELDGMEQRARALKIVVDAGMLDAKELEQLALTSKDNYALATNDDFWKHLCHKRFPSTKLLDPAVASRASFRWWYWAMKADKHMKMKKGKLYEYREFPELPYKSVLFVEDSASRKKFTNLVMMGNVYRNDTAVASFHAEGEELYKLVCDGIDNEAEKIHLVLEDPWVLGPADKFSRRHPHGRNAEQNDDMPQELHVDVWTSAPFGRLCVDTVFVKLHVLRTTDFALSCLAKGDYSGDHPDGPQKTCVSGIAVPNNNGNSLELDLTKPYENGYVPFAEHLDMRAIYGVSGGGPGRVAVSDDEFLAEGYERYAKSMERMMEEMKEKLYYSDDDEYFQYTVPSYVDVEKKGLVCLNFGLEVSVTEEGYLAAKTIAISAYEWRDYDLEDEWEEVPLGWSGTDLSLLGGLPMIGPTVSRAPAGLHPKITSTPSGDRPDTTEN